MQNVDHYEAQTTTFRYCWDAESLLFFGGSILLFLLSSYVNIVCSNFASARSPASLPTLPDLGFEWIPQIQALWLTDLANILLIIPTSLYVFVLDARPLEASTRLFNCFSIVYLLRRYSLIIFMVHIGQVFQLGPLLCQIQGSVVSESLVIFG